MTDDTIKDKPETGVNDNEAALKAARAEAAKHRTERNAALRDAAAVRKVAKAHNIDLSVVSAEAVEKLAIQDGKVVDEFDYTAPAPQVKKSISAGEAPGGQPASSAKSAGLTREDIAKMSPSEINKRWDEVSALMADDKCPF